MQKVHDGRAFPQKLGVREHVEALRVHAAAVQHAPDPLVGIDRHRALFNDHLVPVDGAGNLRDHRLDVGEVGGARIALRRADGDENSLALLHGASQIGREGHAAPPVPGQQLGQMALEDGRPSLSQKLHLGFVVIHTGDMVPHLRKADGRNESHVT